MTRRVISVGHAALDRVYRIERFPVAPAKVRALEHIESGGGMAANAAAAVARLGGSGELWSRVGADAAGRQILALLAADGVDIANVKVCAGARSSTAAVIVDHAGERLIVGERDHAMSMDADWLPLERIAGAGAVLSDLRWIEATRLAFARARALGVPTLIDADLGGAGHLEEFMALSDFAIFSAPALEAFRPGAGEAAQLAAALALGPRHAGVTLGAGGYRWVERGGRQGTQPGIAVAVVDSTGAGDAFHGAFAYGVAEGLETAECARFAATVAALKCRRLGARAGLPTLDEVRRVMALQN